jgi:DNA-binding MarR family transcriptional regulator
MFSAEKSARDLYLIWMRIMNKLNESESIPRKFGIDIPLYPSEIHTLQVIGDHPESNVRAVADRLGITPGAASQTITKLSRRDLVTKVRGLKNEKEVHLVLTSPGQTAYEAHESIHEMVFQKISERIGPLTPENVRFLEHVLHAVESVYDERIEVVRNEVLVKKSQKREDEL